MSDADVNIHELAKNIDRMLRRRGIRDLKLGALSLHLDGTDTGQKCWKRVCSADENGNVICTWVEVPCGNPSV